MQSAETLFYPRGRRPSRRAAPVVQQCQNESEPLSAVSAPTIEVAPSRLYPSRPFKLFVRVGSAWMDEYGLTATSVLNSRHAVSLRLDSTDERVEYCRSCCPAHVPVVLRISGARAFGPHRPDACPGVVEFCFDECRSFCRSSRLHLGGKVNVVLEFLKEDGTRIACAASGPVELRSKPPKLSHPCRSTSPSCWSDISFDSESNPSTEILAPVPVPLSRVPSLSLSATEEQADVPPPQGPGCGCCLSSDQQVVENSPVMSKFSGESLMQLTMRFAAQSMLISALEVALEFGRMGSQQQQQQIPLSQLLPDQSSAQQHQLPELEQQLAMLGKKVGEERAAQITAEAGECATPTSADNDSQSPGASSAAEY